MPDGGLVEFVGENGAGKSKREAFQLPLAAVPQQVLFSFSEARGNGCSVCYEVPAHCLTGVTHGLR